MIDHNSKEATVDKASIGAIYGLVLIGNGLRNNYFIKDWLQLSIQSFYS